MKGTVSILLFKSFVWVMAVLSTSTVNAQHQHIAKEKIGKLAKEYVETVCEACKVDVAVKWMPGHIMELDSSKIQFITLSSHMPRGYQNATLHYQEQARGRGSMHNGNAEIQLYIRVLQYLPVASKRIFSDEEIGEEYVQFQWKDITKMRVLPVTKLENIQNQVATKIVKEGSVFFKKDFENSPVIEAGDTVEMIYQEAGFKIRIECLARESKAEGELIRLYNKETRTTYLAKVINQTKILWEKTL